MNSFLLQAGGSFVRRHVLTLAALLFVGGAVGCGTGSPGSGSTGKGQAGAYTGLVHGGQQPVSGARIHLYAVGNSGYKSQATDLLTQEVYTGADGSFLLTGLWNCNDTATYGSDPLVYLVSNGGDPGIGTKNASIALMTSLGRCSTLTPSTFIFVDEVTTVGAVYALAPFMADDAHIGAPAANMQGLANAFDTANVLVNSSTGTAPGTGISAGESVPAAEINALGNVLATCVNSTGALCAPLFSLTTPAGGAVPSDTISAMRNIASSPLQNVGPIFLQQASYSPFQPSLTNAPADWTMMIRFTGNGLSGPAALALDAAGNAWIANASGAGITGLSNRGVALTGTAGYGSDAIFGAQGIAVDRNGSIWVADTLLNTVFRLTSASGVINGTASFTNGVDGPAGIAIDSANHVWIANAGGGSVTELDNSGTVIGSALTAGATLQAPVGIAVDAAGNAWVTDNTAGVVAKFGSNQALLSGSGFTDPAVLAPQGIAIDSTGRAWVADAGLASVSLFAADGTDAAAPVQGGGLSMPAAVAVDGAATGWVVNNAASGSLTHISADSATATGGFGSLANPMAVAIDSSGSIWTANSGDDSVSKFVGLAVPVALPLAAVAGP